MGVGKKIVEGKTKKVVENATEGIPVVGDVVDKSIKSGPVDRASDGLDDAKKDLDKTRKKAETKVDPAVDDLRSR